MFFNFYLEPWQIEAIQLILDQADIDADAGKPGAIFCQVGRAESDKSKVLMQGSYIDHEEAKNIKDILHRYFKVDIDTLKGRS